MRGMGLGLGFSLRRSSDAPWYRSPEYAALSSGGSTVYPNIVLDFENNRYAKGTNEATTAPVTFAQAIDSYSRASTATYVNSSGLIASAANNVPRFDFDPATGESLGLLLEEQRTNLYPYSTNFSVSNWKTSDTTKTLTSEVAPDGTTNSVYFVAENTANNYHYIVPSASSITTGTNYTVSIFLKAGTAQWIQLCGNNPNTNWANFDLVNGVIGNVGGSGTAKIQSYGNGWYRCSLTMLTTGTNVEILSYLFTDDVNIATRAGSAYVGTGKGVYMWGAQCEQGVFPTSYIPTTGSSATRAPEIARMTGTTFSDSFSQTEGTFVTEWQGGLESLQGGYGRVLAYDGVRNFIGADGVTSLNRIGSWNGTTNLPLTISSSPVTNFVKTAMSYDAGNRALVSGANNSASATGLGIPPTTLGIGGRTDTTVQQINGHLKSVTCYQYKLPTASMQTLTT